MIKFEINTKYLVTTITHSDKSATNEKVFCILYFPKLNFQTIYRLKNYPRLTYIVHTKFNLRS